MFRIAEFTCFSLKIDSVFARKRQTSKLKFHHLQKEQHHHGPHPHLVDDWPQRPLLRPSRTPSSWPSSAGFGSWTLQPDIVKDQFVWELREIEKRRTRGEHKDEHWIMNMTMYTWETKKCCGEVKKKISHLLLELGKLVLVLGNLFQCRLDAEILTSF